MPHNMDHDKGHEMTRFILNAVTGSVFKSAAENPIYIQDAHFLTKGSMKLFTSSRGCCSNRDGQVPQRAVWRSP